ncbi:MAG: glycosyltransferase family 2 protein [Phycisphaerae bacterium]
MRVLIAIPVFNEERYVADILARIRPLSDDILVVDDGSTDATHRILSEFAKLERIRHPDNLGYGRSLIDAFEFAARRDFDWIITIDCDDQHEPALIPAFIERAERDDVDVVSGSRYLRDMPGNTPPPGDRRRINLRITRLLNQKLGLDLTDAFCGFKAFRVSALRRLSLSVPGYAFPLQFWVQAAYRRLRMCELPVHLIYNDPTRHFGGTLDDPEARLRHYLYVFDAEWARVSASWDREMVACDSVPCTD